MTHSRLALALLLSTAVGVVASAGASAQLTLTGIGGSGDAAAVTFDPATATNVTLSAGNLAATPTAVGIAAVSVAKSSFKNTGKWYYECTLTTAGINADGVGFLTTNGSATTAVSVPYSNSGYATNGGGIGTARNVTGVSSGTLGAAAVRGVALDLTNWQVWFRVGSGNWNGSGVANPVTNVGGVDIGGYANSLVGPAVVFASGSTSLFTCNFGSTGSAPVGFAPWTALGNSASDGGFTSFDPATQTNAVLEDGGLIAQHSNTTTGGTKALASSFISSGLRYFEFTDIAPGSNSDSWGTITTTATYADMLPNGANGMLVYPGSGSISSNNALSGSNIGAIGAYQVVSVAVDFTHDNVWFRLAPAGQWNGSALANPATNVGGISFSSFSAATLAPAFGFANSASSISQLNPGRFPFVGAVPAGFTSGWPK